MSSKLKDIKPILADLKKSLTEEEILKNLILLVKGFDTHQYREVIYKNPYYKSLIPDIQKDIIEDLEKISFSITKEIEIIESDLKKIGSKDSEKELKNHITKNNRQNINFILKKRLESLQAKVQIFPSIDQHKIKSKSPKSVNSMEEWNGI